MNTGRYEESARNRQAILDYLNANPGKMGPEIIKALGLDKVVGSDRLGKMYRRGELSREKAMYCGVNSAGKNFCMGTFAYTARVIKTAGADEVLRRLADNLKADSDKPEKPAKVVNREGYYSQHGGGWPANERASGGGQGACRREFGIQSSMA